MAEFQVKIVNSNRHVVADTYILGQSKEEVMEAIADECQSAIDGDSDWADSLDEEFS